MAWRQLLKAPTGAVAFLTCLLTAGSAQGHWCDCLWASSYNVVVRPEQNTLQVSTSGQAELQVHVQNNMGYPLYRFALDAEAAGYSIDVQSDAPRVSGYLMPGERLRHTLTVSGNGTVDVGDVDFFVSFGTSGQDGRYGDQGHVVIKRPGGDIVPSSPAVSAGSQAKHLGQIVKADYRNVEAGIDDLMDHFCAGRGSWSSWSTEVDSNYCNGSGTRCPDRVSSSSASKYDYQRLWAGQQIAARRNEMTADQLATFRERVMCAWNDTNRAFMSMATLILGYLGDSAQTRSFLEDKAQNGGNIQAATAKAALLMLGDTQYEQEVTLNVQSSNDYISMTSAAALGIAAGDDDAVQTALIPLVEWSNPEGDSDDAAGLTAGHVLDLVAWHRRGYKTMADDTGPISFYGEEATAAEPAAPTNLSCSLAGERLALSWSAVTEDVHGAATSVVQYRVYWGPDTNPCPSTCTGPGEGTFDYAHSAVSVGTTYQAAGLTTGGTYYFAVAAENAQSLSSTYSNEVRCVAPTPAEPPRAVLSCTPASGDAPLSVTCHGNDSTCPGCTVDAHYLRLSGEPEEPTATRTYTLSDPSVRTVRLRVVSNLGMQDTDTVQLEAHDATGANQPPRPVVSASPHTGATPLQVSFDASATDDPDGDALTFEWDFGDGSATATGAQTEHVFVQSGVYEVTVTATDDGSPTRTSRHGVTIHVTDRTNEPPLSAAATVSPGFGEAPLKISYDATGVTDPEGSAVSVEWDFGSGDSSRAQSGAYTFNEAGTYTVSMTARDDGMPPRQSFRTFEVTVLGGEGGHRVTAVGGCATTGAVGGAWLLALLLAGIGLLARRRVNRVSF